MTRNIIAVAVLLGLGIAAFLVFRESPEKEERKAEVRATLKPVARGDVDRIEVIRHEGSGDTLREELIVLERAGDAWRMLEPVEYAVNQTSVDRMLDALGELKVIDVIAENRDRHRVLEVDGDLGIEVTASGKGEELAHFIVGVSRKNMTMVRIPGSDTVYRATGSFRVTFNKSAKNIRDRTVTRLDRGSVTRLEIVNEKGELALVKKGEKPSEREGMAPMPIYEPVGVEVENFDERKAAGLANSLTGLTARDFVDEDLPDDVTGLGEGAVKVEFEASRGDEKGTYTLHIGKEKEGDRLTYVRTSLSDQVFLVSSHMVQRYGVTAQDFARTDEQVKKEEEARAAAAAHGESHRQHAEMLEKMKAQGQSMPGAPAGAPGQGQQQIPPEVMKKIRAQIEQQAAQGGGAD